MLRYAVAPEAPELLARAAVARWGQEAAGIGCVPAFRLQADASSSPELRPQVDASADRVLLRLRLSPPEWEAMEQRIRWEWPVVPEYNIECGPSSSPFAVSGNEMRSGSQLAVTGSEQADASSWMASGRWLPLSAGG